MWAPSDCLLKWVTEVRTLFSGVITLLMYLVGAHLAGVGVFAATCHDDVF